MLIAHELNTYASALAGMLAHVRPQFCVGLVPVSELPSEMARFPTALVVSDRIAAVDRSDVGWILYYPEHRDVAIVRLGATERTIDSPDLDDVLAALDDAEQYQAAAFA